MTATYSARNTATIVRDVPIERITASTFNPRKHFDQAALEELAASLQQHGMIEPIVVRQIHTDLPTTPGIAWYEIIAGERRWRASKLAGLETVPTRILGQVDDERALQLALIENLQRQDLDPIEEAQGYHLLNHIVGMKQKQIAESVNRSQPAIANAMRLLDLPDDVQQRIRAGELSRSHGVALAKYKSFPQIVSKLAETAVKQKMTAHDLEGDVLHNYALEQAGLTVRVWNSDLRPICEACPFDAYVANGTYSGVCLKPDHYAELEAAAAEKAKQDNEALLAAAKEAGDPVLKLEDLDRDGYTVIWQGVEGCSRECPCWAVATTSGGHTQKVCLDPARHQELGRLERERHQDRLDRIRKKQRDALKAKVRDITATDQRALALVVALALSHEYDLDKSPIRNHLPKALSPNTKFSTFEIKSSTLDHLAEMEPEALLKMAVDVVMSKKVSNHSNSPHLHWYLGLEEEEATG